MNALATKVLLALCFVSLASGLIACGGGDDLASTKEPSSAPPTSSRGSGARADADTQGSAGSKEGSSDGGSTQASDNGGPPDTSSSFTPKTHTDSGGGAEQFETKGGDNSIQESGEEVDASELEEAAAALHAYLDARAAGAWEAACSYMASGITQSRQQLAAASKQQGALGCPELLAALSAGVPAAARREAAQADVGSLRVEGDRGFILFHGARDTDYFMPMAREDGRWKVAALAASPLA
jgi:hypothetical protein